VRHASQVMSRARLIVCLLLCLLFLLPVSVVGEEKKDQGKKLINIDYLGIGYDALQGNPHSDLEDPGFRQKIFPLEYEQNTLSADGRYLLPDKTSAYQLTSCSFQSDSSSVNSATSYHASLSVGISRCMLRS